MKYWNSLVCRSTDLVDTNNIAVELKYFLVFYILGDIISIFHGFMVWIETSVTRVTDRHLEACRVMPNSDPE